MNIWQYIVIHHSATKDGAVNDWAAIRRYHTQTLGWVDIGYHFGIEEIAGNIEVLVGRPLHREGAHTKQQDMNYKGLGVCFIGNYDVTKPPDAMILTAVHRLIVPLCKVFAIPPTNICPHSDFAVKTCPGTKFPMADLRALVASLL